MAICVPFRINQNSDCACKKVDLRTNCFSATTGDVALPQITKRAKDEGIIEVFFAIEQGKMRLRN
ncbi:hypothetical protein [Massilia violaceinigra]|uniref:hypothetical protein n=1 Tax=Massilia violaceinigra TaxID=2045208 RepID=UPI0012FDF81A|nr:hypothetical protein [Massilia violaceinigra]